MNYRPDCLTGINSERRPRRGGPNARDLKGAGVQNVGYMSHVLAPRKIPGKSGQIRGLVAADEADYR